MAEGSSNSDTSNLNLLVQFATFLSTVQNSSSDTNGQLSQFQNLLQSASTGVPAAPAAFLSNTTLPIPSQNNTASQTTQLGTNLITMDSEPPPSTKPRALPLTGVSGAQSDTRALNDLPPSTQPRGSSALSGTETSASGFNWALVIQLFSSIQMLNSIGGTSSISGHPRLSTVPGFPSLVQRANCECVEHTAISLPAKKKKRGKAIRPLLLIGRPMVPRVEDCLWLTAGDMTVVNLKVKIFPPQPAIAPLQVLELPNRIYQYYFNEDSFDSVLSSLHLIYTFPCLPIQTTVSDIFAVLQIIQTSFLELDVNLHELQLGPKNLNDFDALDGEGISELFGAECDQVLEYSCAAPQDEIQEERVVAQMLTPLDGGRCPVLQSDTVFREGSSSRTISSSSVSSSVSSSAASEVRHSSISLFLSTSDGCDYVMNEAVLPIPETLFILTGEELWENDNWVSKLAACNPQPMEVWFTFKQPNIIFEAIGERYWEQNAKDVPSLRLKGTSVERLALELEIKLAASFVDSDGDYVTSGPGTELEVVQLVIQRWLSNQGGGLLAPKIGQYSMVSAIPIHATLRHWMEIGPGDSVNEFKSHFASYHDMLIASLSGCSQDTHEALAWEMLHNVVVGSEHLSNPYFQVFAAGLMVPSEVGLTLADYAHGFSGGAEGFVSTAYSSSIQNYSSLHLEYDVTGLKSETLSKVNSLLSANLSLRASSLPALFQEFLEGQGTPCPTELAAIQSHFSKAVNMDDINSHSF
uniref:Uncharacterized protein n=1 Tax=Moniliophthora roreri TaxID=221103 RepID=A0A0W0G1S9_MONRR